MPGPGVACGRVGDVLPDTLDRTRDLVLDVPGPHAYHLALTLSRVDVGVDVRCVLPDTDRVVVPASDLAFVLIDVALPRAHGPEPSVPGTGCSPPIEQSDGEGPADPGNAALARPASPR